MRIQGLHRWSTVCCGSLWAFTATNWIISHEKKNSRRPFEKAEVFRRQIAGRGGGRRTGRPIAAEHRNRIVRSRRMSSFPTVATSKTPKMEIRKARPSGGAWPCVFPSPAFNSLPAERDYGIVSRIAPAYCAILKTLSSFSLNAAISCPILSLVIRA